ncbi:MAG: tyrosine-type recombinase/integrase [Clostridia bacterium]|nr:tyrosine-type recombinase/integrase [Clostridia bacterium]
MFIRLMKENGLEKYNFHFHTLRHTYGTMLFEMQENPKIIQMLMGHRNVTTTIQTYNSVDRSFFKRATDKLEQQFKKF